MADLVSHIKQSKHNLECAEKLLRLPHAHDWAITACFYAAIHYVEAGFIAIYEKTSNQMRSTREGTPHAIRQDLVGETFGADCFLKYRDLREASFNVRYLENSQSLDYDHPAEGIFSKQAASEFITIDFSIIYEAVKNEAETHNVTLDF